MRRAFLLIDAEHGLKPGDLQILNIMRRSAIPHQVILSKADKLIDFKNKIPKNDDKMNKRLAKLRETSEQIRDVVQPCKERRFSALGEILACSAEKKINGKRLGIDAVRFAVLQAALRDGAEQADRHLVSTLQTRTWRLHDLCGSADFMSDLCLRLVIWRA